MIESIIGAIVVVMLCIAFKLFVDFKVRRAELMTYVGCAIAFKPNEFHINYHQSNTVSGVDTVLQFQSEGDFMYTFIFEEGGVIRAMVNEKQCMTLRNSVNIFRDDHLYHKLQHLKTTLIAED